MAHIFVSFNINGVTDNCFMVVRENSNLLVEVYRSALLTAPHTQREVTVDNLNPVMHRVQIWTTLDDATLNTLIGACDIQASDEGAGLTIVQFITDRGTDGDPVAGENIYVADGVVTGRPNLDGATYVVFKPGDGPLNFGLDIEKIVGGGFQFINGDSFSANEKYTILVLSTGTASAPPAGVGDIADVIDVTEDMDAVPGAMMAFDFAGNVGVVTMPDLTTTPDKTAFAFNTHQGSQINGEVAFLSGQGVYFMGSFRNRVFLGKNEELKLIIKGGKAYVLNYSGVYLEVGRRVWGDILSAPNELLMDGTEYDGTVYKRLYDYITGVLPADQKVTYTQFDTTSTVQTITGVFAKRGFFAVNGTNFKVPDMNNKSVRALKTGSDTERVDQKAGGYQQDSYRAHSHPITASTLQNFVGSGHVPGVNPDTDESGGSTDNTGGTETRPINIGLYPKIII